MNIKPVHFSEYFGVSKEAFNLLGTLDPILNYDTKVFVEPLLLKSSTSTIIQQSYQTYKEFFAALLLLLRNSKNIGDKCWRTAQKMVHFPEYQYTCIGYSSGNTEGRGSGIEFNDKIFQSAKEIVELAQDDPEIFLLLPLLEEGIAGDRISDMVQNIIDDEICRYTVDIMGHTGLQGNMSYETRNYKRFSLLQNPFSKHPIKLLPKDILSNLPVADNVGSVVHELAEFNERLRTIVSRDIGHIWLETTKSAQKEMLLKELKTNKPFFIETLKALKDYSFEHYDLEKDYEGLYKWLSDSDHFIHFELSKEMRVCPDTIEALLSSAIGIISHFKNLIENSGVWKIFWVRHRLQYRHVREYYSQMIFYTVCSTWLTSQDSNIKITLLQDKNPIRLKLSISDKCSLILHIKHANNTSLLRGYTDTLEQSRALNNEKHVFLILNFEEQTSAQLKTIRVIENPICNIFDVNAYMKTNNESLIDFEDLGFKDEGYIEEKRKGGLNSHQNRKSIKACVEALCIEELSNKTYSSVLQLSKHVAKRIVNEFPKLLQSFEPYKKHLLDGSDWTTPTFYRWCTKAHDAFKNKSETVHQ